MIGMYETPQFGQAGLLAEPDADGKADKAYKFNDVIPAVRNGLSANGKLYASPFYAESSFLMYRKDVLAKAGVTMPVHPTWDQVATIARKVNTLEHGRHLPARQARLGRPRRRRSRRC